MRFLSLLVANFKMTIRNRQALFWTFLFPVLIMSLMGIVFGNQGESSAKIAIVNQDKTELSNSLEDTFEKIKAFKVEKRSYQKALDRLKRGDVDAVIIFEKDFAPKSPLMTKPAEVKLYYDPSSVFVSQMVKSAASSVIEGANQQMTKVPKLIKVKSKSVQVKRLKFIDFLIPGILGMSLMMSGITNVSATLTTYRERGILRRLKVTPMSLTQFLTVRVITQLLIAFLQAAILIIIGLLFFDLKIVGNYLYLAVAVTIGSLCFITIGFTLSSLSKNSDAANALSNVVTVPMMFLSGIFFPIDNAPAWIQPVVKMMPLKYLADALRDIMVKDRTLAFVRNDLLVLLAVTVLFFVISVKLFKWE